MPVVTLNALNTLYSLNALSTIRAIGNDEGGSASVCESYRVCIYESYCISLCNSGYAVTRCSRNALRRLSGVYSVYIPIAVLYSYNRSMPVVTLNALNTLDSLNALSAIRAIGNGEGGGASVCIGYRIRIY